MDANTPRTVLCKKLGRQLPGLPHPPFADALGARIYHEISAEAWKGWLGHATMVINENRLNPAEPDAQVRLRRELEAYLFGGGAAAPAGYVPPT